MRLTPSIACRTIAGGRELQVQTGQPPQQVRRHVLIGAAAGGTVRGFGDPDVGRAVEQALEAHPRLGPGQRGSGAGVDPVPERDVLPRVRPVDLEGVGHARIGAGRGWRRC